MNDGHRVALAVHAADALGSIGVAAWPGSIISPKIAIRMNGPGQRKAMELDLASW